MIRTLTITYHSVPNLGAFLQAYALHKTLNDMGDIQDEILDFTSPRQIAIHTKEIYSRSLGIRSALVYLWGLMHRKDVRKRQALFEKQRMDFLHLTKPCKRWEEVKELITSGHYDVLISGSDQIWNPELGDFSPVYYYPGLKHKISYGSSLGFQISDPTIKYLKRFAGEYSWIAARETEAARVISEITGREIPVILDPSLLLEKEDYLPLTKNYPNNKIEKFILFYSVICDPSVIQKARQLSKHYHLPVIAIYNGGVFRRAARERVQGFKVDFLTDPGKFIWYIMNAEMVLTDSFHGTAMSVLFHKNFLRIQEVHNGYPKKDNRIDTLLSSLSLEERTVSILSEDLPSGQVDWDLVDETLNRLKADSKSWLEWAVRSTAGEKR